VTVTVSGEHAVFSLDESVTRCPDDDTPTQLIEPEDDLIGKVIDDRFTIKAVLGVGLYLYFSGDADQGTAIAPTFNDGPGIVATVRF